MALSPFDPQPDQSQDQPAPASPPLPRPRPLDTDAPKDPTQSGIDVGKLGQQWSDWIDKPSNRAAMLQFGIAALQPMGFGETTLSHLAGVVGAGGEAAANVNKQALAERAESSKEELAQARAEAASARTGAAASNLENARARLEMQQRLGESLEESRGNKAAQDAANEYWKQKGDVIAGKNLPDYDTWLKTYAPGVYSQRRKANVPSTEPLGEPKAFTADAIANSKYGPLFEAARGNKQMINNYLSAFPQLSPQERAALAQRYGG